MLSDDDLRAIIAEHAAMAADSPLRNERSLEMAEELLQRRRAFARQVSGERCQNMSPGWFTGRWRDWHRGHGCELDDGEPVSANGAAMIAKGMKKP